MSKANALAGLIGSYGDSDDDSDDGMPKTRSVPGPNVRSAPAGYAAEVPHAYAGASPAIHPAPIAHCPWSACYDESSGYTYYWNQNTNVVTWEAPPEYLLAVKLAQQQLNAIGTTEVSAEEWQLYQQALAEKQAQSKVISKPTVVNSAKKDHKEKNTKKPGKRSYSDDDDVKIELITSYHNSDSDSNDETDSPTKVPPAPVVANTPKVSKTSKTPHKKKKVSQKTVEYGPPLPPNQNYTIPIGPELPPALEEEIKPKSPENKNEIPTTLFQKIEKSVVCENEDSQDENTLLSKLKDKAKILENLGGEIPVDIKKIIQEDPNSKPLSPKVETEKDVTNTIDTNIDDLLEEIEKKELPKVVKNKNVDMFSDSKSAESTPKNSPKPVQVEEKEEIKPLFPSSKNITEEPIIIPSLASKLQENGVDKDVKENLVIEKKPTNLYLSNSDDFVENTTRKKFRISNSVLPVKKSETPSYTTKYSQLVDGFMSERTGLGFSKDDDEDIEKKNTVSYGNGLMFTKGEILNEDKKDEELDDMSSLVEAKLKYLNQLQPTMVTPVQEMLIQMQTLVAAYCGGSLARGYWRRWVAAAGASLARHEASAAPPGWLCAFQRSEGRYRYERESDGLVQWEYPAVANMDMDISTTPPHPGIEAKEECPPPLPPPPPPPPAPPAPAPAPPSAPSVVPPAAPPSAPPAAPPSAPPAAPRTPPPPTWHDPPPPGCDDLPPPLPPEPKQEIGDELLSFYNDIAELEKHTLSPAPHTAGNSPEPPLPPPEIKEAKEKPRERERERDRDKDKDKDSKNKKKSKVKISTSMGIKHKSVSSLVAKWQQVADEIHSD